MWNDDNAFAARGFATRSRALGGVRPVGVTGRTGRPPARARSRVDTASIALRVLGPDSARPFCQYIDALSAESRAFRFLAPVRGLIPDLLRRLVDVDQRGHVAWVAEHVGAPGTFIAEVRYVTDEFGGAEFAVSVADAFQNRGLGRFLMRLLLAHAAGCGISRMSGTIRADNASALALVRGLGFAIDRDFDDAGLRYVELGLWAFGRAPPVASGGGLAKATWPPNRAPA